MSPTAPYVYKQRPWWYMWEGKNALELQPLTTESTDSREGAIRTVSNSGSHGEISSDPLTSSNCEGAHTGVRAPGQALDSSRTIISARLSRIHDVLFPPNAPRELQLFRVENVGLLICYLVVGTMQGLVRPLLNVYPIDLGATEAQQTTIATIMTLPAAFKLMFGFWSDNVPIMGYRRKPYMLMGWLQTSVCMFVLLASSNLTMHYDHDNAAVPPTDAPSTQLLAAVFFTLGVGLWFADVMADSLVAQKARLEPSDCKGQMQSSCYVARFVGLVIAAPVSNYLYSSRGPGSVVVSIMYTPLVMVPLIYYLEEDVVEIRAVKEQCQEIFQTTCKRSVWQPMGFVYLFNIMQVSNSAWRQYLQTVLGFNATDLNDLLIASYILLCVGIMAYKFMFLHSSWRYVFLACIVLNGVVSGLQLALIQGWTFGLDVFWFALGDDAFAEFLQGMQFLPTAMMMVELCPVGSEGASYAMFTTAWNSAMMLAPAISSQLLGIWDVSKETLEGGLLDGLFKLSLLTTSINMIPILFLGWLPHGRDELLNLQNRPHSGSPIGGGLFLTVVVFSMLWTLVVGMLNVFRPGWGGGS